MSVGKDLSVLDPIIEKYINEKLAPRGMCLGRAKTASELWQGYGFPSCGLVDWFRETLRDVGCQIKGRGSAPGATGRPLFDPDIADAWIRNGGRLFVEQKIVSLPAPSSPKPAP